MLKLMLHCMCAMFIQRHVCMVPPFARPGPAHGPAVGPGSRGPLLVSGRPGRWSASGGSREVHNLSHFLQAVNKSSL